MMLNRNLDRPTQGVVCRVVGYMYNHLLFLKKIMNGWLEIQILITIMSLLSKSCVFSALEVQQNCERAVCEL